MMEMAVPGRRKKGRPRRRWMDLAREDIERVGAQGRRQSRPGEVENTFALWRPRIGKSRKKKFPLLLLVASFANHDRAFFSFSSTVSLYK